MNKSTFTQSSTTSTSYRISLKSKSGNTVAFINLTDQFLKAVLGKSKANVTLDEVNSINSGDLAGYLSTLEIDIANVQDNQQITEASKF